MRREKSERRKNLYIFKKKKRKIKIIDKTNSSNRTVQEVSQGVRTDGTLLKQG